MSFEMGRANIGGRLVGVDGWWVEAGGGKGGGGRRGGAGGRGAVEQKREVHAAAADDNGRSSTSENAVDASAGKCVKLGGVISANIVRRLEYVNAVVRNATHFGGCHFTGANVKSFCTSARCLRTQFRRLKRRAISTATADLPVAVGPLRTRTRLHLLGTDVEGGGSKHWDEERDSAVGCRQGTEQ